MCRVRRIIHPYARAWKPSVSPKISNNIAKKDMAKTRAFFEIKVRARTRGQQKKNNQTFIHKLIHELPVEISHKVV
jgi:hypothetical protein